MSLAMEESYFRDVARRLKEAQRITAITGAGVSAARGVPAFRGTDGLWRSHRSEDLATPQAFRRDPRLVWEWYDAETPNYERRTTNSELRTPMVTEFIVRSS